MRNIKSVDFLYDGFIQKAIIRYEDGARIKVSHISGIYAVREYIKNNNVEDYQTLIDNGVIRSLKKEYKKDSLGVFVEADNEEIINELKQEARRDTYKSTNISHIYFKKKRKQDGFEVYGQVVYKYYLENNPNPRKIIEKLSLTEAIYELMTVALSRNYAFLKYAFDSICSYDEDLEKYFDALITAADSLYLEMLYKEIMKAKDIDLGEITEADRLYLEMLYKEIREDKVKKYKRTNQFTNIDLSEAKLETVNDVLTKKIRGIKSAPILLIEDKQMNMPSYQAQDYFKKIESIIQKPMLLLEDKQLENPLVPQSKWSILKQIQTSTKQPLLLIEDKEVKRNKTKGDLKMENIARIEDKGRINISYNSIGYILNCKIQKAAEELLNTILDEKIKAETMKLIKYMLNELEKRNQLLLEEKDPVDKTQEEKIEEKKLLHIEFILEKGKRIAQLVYENEIKECTIKETNNYLSSIDEEQLQKILSTPGFINYYIKENENYRAISKEQFFASTKAKKEPKSNKQENQKEKKLLYMEFIIEGNTQYANLVYNNEIKKISLKEATDFIESLSKEEQEKLLNKKGFIKYYIARAKNYYPLRKEQFFNLTRQDRNNQKTEANSDLKSIEFIIEKGKRYVKFVYSDKIKRLSLKEANEYMSWMSKETKKRLFKKEGFIKYYLNNQGKRYSISKEQYFNKTKIGKIALYKDRKDQIKATVFYIDGTTKELSYDEAHNKCLNYIRLNKIKNCDKLFEAGVLFTTTKKELKKNFEEIKNSVTIYPKPVEKESKGLFSKIIKNLKLCFKKLMQLGKYKLIKKSKTGTMVNSNVNTKETDKTFTKKR